MNNDDREHFAKAITRLFAIYSDELTDNVLEAWWGVLKPYSLQEIRLAMSAHATDPERGHYRPVPADIIRHITVTLPKRRKEQADAEAVRIRTEARPLEMRLSILQREVEMGLKQEADVAAEIAGLNMQLGALRRLDRMSCQPRIFHKGDSEHAMRALEQCVKAIPAHIADRDDDSDPHHPA